MIQCKIVSEGGRIPRKSHSFDAGFDIFANEDIDVQAGSSVMVSTGIAVAIPVGHYGQLASRSGLASKERIITIGGVIDSGYRGEVKVVLMNLNLLGKSYYSIKRGDAISQLVIIRISDDEEIDLVEDLPSSSRGASGFGSTG